MARSTRNLGTITIANGGTQGDILEVDRAVAGHVIDLLIVAPAALTGTCTLQAACTTGAVAGDLRAVQIVPGTDLTLAANKATAAPIGAFTALSILSGSAEGAARAFVVMAQMDSP